MLVSKLSAIFRELKYILLFFCRNKTLTIEKQFFNQMKTITYNAETWLKVKKFFNTIQQSKLMGSSVKFHIGREMFLVSNMWGEYKKRYTGIHAFNIIGGIKPVSGVNLDDDEWNMLTFNFLCVKDALNGKKDALKDVFTPPKDVTDMIKVYKAKWYLNGKLITNSESGREFFSCERLLKMLNAENPNQLLIIHRKMCYQKCV